MTTLLSSSPSTQPQQQESQPIANHNNNNNNNSHINSHHDNEAHSDDLSQPRTPIPANAQNISILLNSAKSTTTNFNTSTNTNNVEPTFSSQTVPVVTPRSLASIFTRRVSFNNLNPEDDSNVSPNQPIYNQIDSPNSNYTTTSQPQTSINSLLSNTHNNQLQYSKKPEFLFNSQASPFQTQQQHQHHCKKRLKLPKPPEKSILKNKVSQQQIDHNARYFGNIEGATINYHNDDNVDEDADDEQAVADEDEKEKEKEQETETEEQEEHDNDYDNNNLLPSLHLHSNSHGNSHANSLLPPGGNKPRRKSYAEMTDEELMALDPQFLTTRPRTANFDAFKFDSQKTYYRSERRSSSSSTSQVAAALSNKQHQLAQCYPTSNENNYKSIALTTQHREFDHTEYGRTIITVISGRKHTWHSTDWLLGITEEVNEITPQLPTADIFLVDGDYLVVTCLISRKFVKGYNSRWRKKTMDEYLKEKCLNLIEYYQIYLARLNLRVKLTVEFVIDDDLNPNSTSTNTTSSSNTAAGSGYKFMLHHIYKQYQPNIIVVGNKSSNLNFKYPLKLKKSVHDEYMIKLSSYIVKYSTVPVILVGGASSNFTGFNENLFTMQKLPTPPSQVPKITFNDDKNISPNQSFANPPAFETPTTTLGARASKTDGNNNGPCRDRDHDRGLGSDNINDIDDTHSMSSSSIESVESFTPKEYTDVNNDTKIMNNTNISTNNGDADVDELSSTIKFQIDSIPFNSPAKYLEWVSYISDQSYKDSQYYLRAIQSEDGSMKIDDRIHQIFRSKSYAGVTHNSLGGSFSSHGGGGSFLNQNHGGSMGLSSDDRVYKVKSLISIEDDEEVKKRKELRRENRRNGSGASGTGSSSRLGSKSGSGFMSLGKNNSKLSLSSSRSSDSNEKGKKQKKEVGKKTSFWKKIGLKK